MCTWRGLGWEGMCSPPTQEGEPNSSTDPHSTQHGNLNKNLQVHGPRPHGGCSFPGRAGLLQEQMQPQSQQGPLQDGEDTPTSPVRPLEKKGCRILV